MLYCYFIARAQAEIEKLTYRTLDATPVQFVRERELVAAVRPLPAGTRSTPELMLEHGSVLATASKSVTVLPLRFGTIFRSETAILTLLGGRSLELLAALERLEGKIEMGLRLSLSSEAEAQEQAAAVAAACRPLDSWMEVRPCAAGGAILELAHLIDRGDVEAYRQRAKSLGLEVAGPRPPFRFLPQFLRLPARAERRVERARAAAAGQTA